MCAARSVILLGSLACCAWAMAGSWAEGGIRYDVAVRPGRPAVELSIRGELGNDLEARLFADAADGRWDEHTLLTAALVAGGTSRAEELRRYKAQMAGLVDELRRSGAVRGTPREKAQAVFEFLHRRVLVGGYQLDATDPAGVLDHGRFNCVSASVLFNCLAAEFGLRACGLEIPGHAMSRVMLPEGPLDVETTCPEWFRLLDDPEKQAERVQERLGFQPKEAAPREVSQVALVATIYYNRGVDLLAEKRFAEAAAANAKALRLDPSSVTARGNLLATFNNWAIELGSQGQYQEAVARLREGLAIDPDYATFKTNFAHVHHQWVEALCRQGKYPEALEVLAAAATTLPEETYFAKGRLEVYRRWAREEFRTGDTEAAFAVLTEAKRRLGSRREVLDVEAAEVTYRASVLLDEGRFAEALALFDTALARQPHSAVLQQNRQVTLARWTRDSGGPALASEDVSDPPSSRPERGI